MSRCKHCGSRAKPHTKYEGIVILNANGKLTDYDTFNTLETICAKCGEVIEDD